MNKCARKTVKYQGNKYIANINIRRYQLTLENFLIQF